MLDPIDQHFRSTRRELTSGEPVYDLVRNQPMVVSEYKGSYDDQPTTTQDAIRDAPTNDFIDYDVQSGILECTYLTIDSHPSKTYAFPEERLARPRVENAAVGELTAAQSAHHDLLRRMFALLETNDTYDHFRNLLGELATDVTDQRLVDTAHAAGQHYAEDHFDDHYEYTLVPDDE